MSRVPSLVALVTTVGFTLACMGGGPSTFVDCECAFELPSGWDGFAEGEHAWVAESFGGGQRLRVDFIERSGRSGPVSAAVTHDLWVHDDFDLPVDIAPTAIIDGRAATVRDLGEYWTAMVPYDDGLVYLEAWSEDPDTRADVEALARTLTRPPTEVQLPVDAVPVEPRPESIAERPLEIHREQRWDRGEHRPVPVGWVPTTYSSPVGDLAAWVSPLRDSTPRAGVVLVHSGFGRLWPYHAEAMAPLRDRGVPVLIPAFRGEMGNPGQHEWLGGEVDDLGAAIEAFRERADVDPEQVYLVGLSSGSALALFGALADPTVAGTVLLGGALEQGAFRERTGGGYSFSPVERDEALQDAVRSPTRYMENLASPVWAFHGEFGDDAIDGAHLKHAAHAAGAPYQGFLVPRARSSSSQDAHWPHFLIEALARRITTPELDDEDEPLPLAFDAAFADLLGRRDWSIRWARTERATVQRQVEALARTRLVRPERIVDGVVEERGWVDRRPVRTEAWRLLSAWNGPAPSAQAVALRRAFSALTRAGLAVRPARPSSTADDAVAAGLAERPARGFVYATVDDLLESVERGASLRLFYGDQVPRTDEGTLAVGQEVAAALEAEGLTVLWNGSPSSVIAVDVAW